MKLDPECIRDVLLVVEDKTDFGQGITLNGFENTNVFEKYTEDKILYHVRQAEWSGLLQKVDWFIDGDFLIRDLSPVGHEFLNNIRAESNWKSTKDIANKVGSFSLDALKSIATGVTTAAINRYLGQ